MARFEGGDRVQLAGDIARFYSCIVGTIVEGESYPASVLNQYRVHLADGTFATFFDFQLIATPAIRASLLFDSSLAKKATGTRGPLDAADRHLRFVARDAALDLGVSGSKTKSIIGEVAAGSAPLRGALITLLVNNHPIASTRADETGSFQLADIAAGDIAIEVFAPGRRVFAVLAL